MHAIIKPHTFAPYKQLKIVVSKLKTRQLGKAFLPLMALSVPPGTLLKTLTTTPGVFAASHFQGLLLQHALCVEFHMEAGDREEPWKLQSGSPEHPSKTVRAINARKDRADAGSGPWGRVW